MFREEPATAEIAELRARVASLERELDARSADQMMSRTILETIPAVVLRVSVAGVIESVNRVLPEYSGADLVGQSIYVFAPPDQHAVMREALEGAIQTRQTTSYETIAEAPDGTRDWYLTNVGPILDGGRLLGLTLICINTSRWRAVEAELTRSRAQLRLTVAAGNLGLWTWDRTHDVVEWDDKLCAMFGISPDKAPRTAEEFVDLVPTDQRAAMRAHIEAAIERGVYTDFELRVDRPDGVRWLIIKGGVTLDAAGAVTGLLGGVVDNTALKKLEEHVHQAQKLEAIGQISAGIAHNFNNMLAVIMPTLELAKRNQSPPQLIDDALESASHAAQLVKQLMVFSRGTVVTSLRREPLSESVRRAVDLCRKTFDRRIELQLDGLERVSDVLVGGADMEQVLVNLLLNARDALDPGSQGPARILVALRRLSLEETHLRHPGAAGRSAEVRVSDTGAGMDDATRRRIFEPFFTTKAPGRGTGLGLSTAWATVRSHQGLIECESAAGVGTTFTLLLQGGAPENGCAADTQGSATPRYEGRVALVIDDEDAVRRVLAALLEALGFSALCAASGTEGVSLAARGPVDVVFLDHSMPGQSAERTLSRLRAIHPQVPVVCCSGLGVELPGATARLQKPFGLDELSSTLASALGAPKG